MGNAFFVIFFKVSILTNFILFHHSHTFMKIGKGKNFKLKTPTCKALKRLHNLNDSDSIAQHLPKDVTIELLPASNYAWLRVQSVAHNPTLRVKCTPQKRLATLIEFLEQLWNVTARRNHLCELHTGRSLDLTKQQSNMRATPGKEDRRLRLRPHPALTKNMTSVRLLRHQTHQTHSQSDISLNAYLSKANSWPENKKKRNLHNLSSHGCSKKANREESSVKKNDTNANEQSKPGPTIAAQSELSPDSTEKSNISPIIETVRSLNALNNMVSSSCEDPMRSESPEFTNERSSDEESLRNTRMKPSEEDAIPPPGVTIGEWLSGNVKTDTLLNQEPDKSTESNYGYIKSPLNTKSAFNNEEELCRTIDMNVLRNGWTIEQTDELTIGELCLIFKSKGTLILQYDWDFVQSMPVKSVLSRLISAATIALNHFHKEHEEFAPVNPISSPVKHSRLPSLNTNSRKTKRFRSLDMSVNVAADEIKQSCSSTGPSVVRVEDLADKDKELSDTRTDKDSHKAERFVIPNSPAPRPPTAKQPPKNRIVDEALLQEAKDQLNGKFTTRRLSRKPTIVKPQQYHLSLNANQILGTNLRQLLAGKGISNQTYVSASTDSPSIISMIAAAAATSQSSSSSNNMFIRQNPTSNKQLSSAKSQPSKCTTAISVPEPINIQPATIEISNPVANSISTVTTIQPCGSNDEQNRLLKSNKTNNKVIADELPIGPVKSNVDASIATSIDSTVEKSSDLYPRPPSPPSLSCLLDMSLGDSGALFNDSTDKFFFSSLMQSSSSSFKSGSLSTPTKTQIEQQEQDCQQTIPAAITPFQMHFQRLNEPTVPPTEVGSFDSVNQSTKSSINQMLNLDSNSLTGSSSAWLYNSNADLSLNNLFDCSLDHHSSAPSCSVTTNQSNEVKSISNFLF